MKQKDAKAKAKAAAKKSSSRKPAKPKQHLIFGYIRQ